MQASEILFDLNTEFHMLRHFEDPDQNIIRSLVKNGYKDNEIQNEINFISSRFFKSFASNISELLSQLFKFNYNISDGVNGNLVLEFSASTEKFPYGIGTNCIIQKKTLTAEVIDRIYYLTNRDYTLAHLDVLKLPITISSSVILKNVDSKFIFVTAFPGLAAMPIPDSKMAKELFILCQNFWDEHVFLNLVR